MKRLVSVLLTAALFLSLAGSALADWTDTPWAGGKDLREYTGEHPAKGFPTGDHPAPHLIQKKPVVIPFARYTVTEDDCCIFCVIAGCDCECGFSDEERDYHSVSGNWSEFPTIYFSSDEGDGDIWYPHTIYYCGVANCWCMELTTEDAYDAAYAEAHAHVEAVLRFHYDGVLQEDELQAALADIFAQIWAQVTAG